MKAKKLHYWFGGVLGAILISAIGSGVWLRFLSPALSWFIDVVIQSLSFISGTFKDSIYREAAKGFHEAPSLETFTLCSALMTGVMVASAFALYALYTRKFKRSTSGKLSKEELSKIRRNTKRYCVIGWILVLVIICIYLPTCFKLLYVGRITTQSLNSIDIIAPFIEQKEYLSLKSDFLRIKNAEDYEAFHRKMVELSDKHEIELSLIKPL